MHWNRWRFIRPAAALLIGAVAAGCIALAGLADPPRLAGEPRAASILITDRHGRTLYEAIDPNGSKQVPVPLDEIPPSCRHATIATEDSRFYTHPGVDLLGIARALWQSWRKDEAISGTSTLTQQLARNLYLTPQERAERTLRRKLREAWLAWRLERTHSKDELLALYLNTTYYGHFATGIEAAAQAYFGVPARELDLAQCALLAGLPQSPTAYNPIENLEAAQNRQMIVLGLMVRHDYITPAQAEEAGGERLAFAATPFPIEAPHFVMWVQSQLETLLSADQMRAGGLRVTTTLDLDWQRQAEAIVARRLAQLRPCTAGISPAEGCDPDADPARRVENAALVALDPHTGAVLALVGSPDYFDPAISGAVNAALALRQPGSAIKPLTYAAALDPERAREAGEAPWTAATIIPDLRAAFLTAEGEPYVPNNYDRRYHGPVTVRTALANSYNIPAVRTLDAIGVDALIKLAARVGIPWDREARNWKLEAGNSKLETRKLETGSWRLRDGREPGSSFQRPETSFQIRSVADTRRRGGAAARSDRCLRRVRQQRVVRRAVCGRPGGDAGGGDDLGSAIRSQPSGVRGQGVRSQPASSFEFRVSIIQLPASSFQPSIPASPTSSPTSSAMSAHVCRLSGRATCWRSGEPRRRRPAPPPTGATTGRSDTRPI